MTARELIKKLLEFDLDRTIVVYSGSSDPGAFVANAVAGMSLSNAPDGESPYDSGELKDDELAICIYADN